MERSSQQGMPLALSSGSLYTYGLERVFELAAWAGFDGLEILIDSRWDTRQVDYLRRLQARYGLPVLSLHAPFLVVDVDGWERCEILRLGRTVALAEELGARTVVVHPPSRWYWASIAISGGRRWRFPLFVRQGRDYARWLQTELTQFQAGTAVIIALENMPIKRWGRWRLKHFCFSAVSELERFSHLTLDTTHVGTWGWDILEVYERLKERVAHVHISDYNDRKRRKEHRLPGEGTLPLARFLRRLAADSFEGVVVLELDPEPLQAVEEMAVRAHLVTACDFCRRQGVGW